MSEFPTTSLAENSSPELLHAVRTFAEKHDLSYTIHLAQSRGENEYMLRHQGLLPTAYLDKHEFLGPPLFAAHCRYIGASDIALLGGSGSSDRPRPRSRGPPRRPITGKQRLHCRRPPSSERIPARLGRHDLSLRRIDQQIGGSMAEAPFAASLTHESRSAVDHVLARSS